MRATDAIAAVRAAIGVSCWATPVTASRLFGIDIAGDVSGKLYLRLGGTRDLALAAASRGATGASKPAVMRVAAACDIADIVAVALARRQGSISGTGAALFWASSLACLALSAKAATEGP